MRNLKLDDEEFRKEVKVVMEERRLRTEDRPEALTFEKFMATAYTTHAYKNPVIGWMPDLERMTAADARTWYERWYAPNNATLVVVGDVNPVAVFALARRYFGPVPRRDVVAYRLVGGAAADRRAARAHLGAGRGAVLASRLSRAGTCV